MDLTFYFICKLHGHFIFPLLQVKIILKGLVGPSLQLEGLRPSCKLAVNDYHDSAFCMKVKY